MAGAFSAQEVASQFTHWTSREMDFEIEGRTAERLRRNAAPYEIIPRIHWHLDREDRHPFGERSPDPRRFALLAFGGFPEPLFAGDEAERRIWSRDRLSRVVREDLRDLEQVR